VGNFLVLRAALIRCCGTRDVIPSLWKVHWRTAEPIAQTIGEIVAVSWLNVSVLEN